MSDGRSARGAAEMVVAMVLAGTIGVFVVEVEQSAWTVVFFRCLFAALALGAYCWFRGYFARGRLDRRTVSLCLIGGACLVLNWVFLFKSYELTSISLATVIYHTQPFMIVALGPLLFKEAITLDRIVWIVLAFLGLILVIDIDLLTLEVSPRYLGGISFALLAALLYAGNTLSTKAIGGVQPELVAFSHVTLGTLCLLPFIGLSDLSVSGRDWLLLGALGVVHTCVLYILMYAAYGKLQTAAIAVLSFVYPVVAILADYVVYGERLSLGQWIGVAVILLSGLAVNRNWSISRSLAVKDR